ncbi:e0ba1df1-5ebb-44ee-a2ad-20f47573167e [Thermothielavioides terrestris]|uniref:E0ba1df1-5ebb-44ee-a2ad-20f47573167e n=1 Tax=Thermothielavioides terrestris TaxID=2587410 RepID=A0A446B5M4_9PEZI|nr:e0ba1df1-5ebb-44ee-a2ad-20f47573167e [Thermothielavioides terrestris]
MALAVGDLLEETAGEQSEELKSALSLMPEKRYTDCLVDNWLGGANHQYYALYPPQFRAQYDGWWATPRNRVRPELTSLILRVCACSLHFIIDDHVKVRLEAELETDVLTLSARLHAAAEKLGESIPPGKGGLVHVQQLFLTACWCLHQDQLSEGMSEFDREMRRRMWVILYLWDFALSSMLSRPLLINHADCTVEMPTLTLENNPQRPNQPSPFRHMNLHCQLCIDMAAQLGRASDSSADKAQVAWRMKEVVDKWLANLPAEYALDAPDTRWDDEYEWVTFQRRYLHLIGYMGSFSQLRPFLTRNSSKPMSRLELSLRAAGVQACLGLMDVSWTLFENLVSIGAKFHYAIFCIFDSATVMCSAILQDEARNLPQRETVLEGIRKALRMLAEASSESKTTTALYRILKGLLVKLPLSPEEQGAIRMPKRSKDGSDTMTTPTASMLAAIQSCTLLDDVFNEDPTTMDLESHCAALTGKEAGLFVLSGTMGNQLALRSLLTQPPHGVLCDYRSHIVKYEAGGVATLTGALVKTVVPKNGVYLTLEDIKANVYLDDDVHTCPTRVISLENTLNGMIMPLQEVRRISAFARQHGLKMHCDGARLWEVAASGAGSLVDFASCFDTVSLCFSKGLGAPIGSILVGSKDVIKHARWVRKSIGGGLRQSGVVTAAARVAVDETFGKGPNGEGGLLRNTHVLAQEVSKMWTDLGGKLVHPVHTNMVWLDLDDANCTGARFEALGREAGLKLLGGRLVIHYQIYQNRDFVIPRLANIFKAVLGGRGQSGGSHASQDGETSMYRSQ